MGIFLGLLSSAAFGLIPLFTLPLLNAGISVHTALFYRFSIATLVMWGILALKGEKIATSKMDLLKLGFLSSMYLFAVVLFFYAFNFLARGIVAAIQFVYPVMVMRIMIFFFHEKFSWLMAFSIILAVFGVTLLSTGPGVESSLENTAVLSDNFIFWGIVLSLLAGLANALYFVGIKVTRLPNISGLVMTFYVMLFGAIFCLGNALAFGTLQWIGTLKEFCTALLLALVTAVLSNLTLIMAIKKVGPTVTSILGVMEPLTAVAVGVLVFGETFSSRIAFGILLIVISVALVIFGSHVRRART